ncbi:MAG TPA: DUF1684 domain-containing protein [Vicinamibacteria bacterium]|nr:DUF1684 domain-containing protein [Vicinamibacteria bacterium]
MRMGFRLLGLLLAAGSAVGAESAAYRIEIDKWRTEREARLTADGGWLTVTGLFWLKDGPNRMGSAPDADLVLPGSVPARVGVLDFRGGQTAVMLDPGVTATVEGKPVVKGQVLAPDSKDVLSLGRVTLQVIKRQDRVGVRMKDLDSKARRQFKGLRFFPVKESYRITARWVAHASPRPLPILNVLGQVNELPSPGHAEFRLNGKSLRLAPVIEEPGDQELFFIFRDQTSAKETYGAGRFLYAAMPKDGVIVLDFNKAYSPPCAFTAFATCPLPPKENRLPVRIEAGELAPPGH